MKGNVYVDCVCISITTWLDLALCLCRVLRFVFCNLYTAIYFYKEQPTIRLTHWEIYLIVDKVFVATIQPYRGGRRCTWSTTNNQYPVNVFTIDFILRWGRYILVWFMRDWWCWFMLMVFHATFNNISAISWW